MSENNTTALANPLAAINFDPANGSVDPWAMQQVLMAASDQHMPAAPQLHGGVMLYAALNLEENSEILDGLTKALTRITSEGQANAATIEKLSRINALLQEAGALMKQNSLDIRAELKTFPTDYRAELSRPEVKEMADGTTDLTVTNSGFALSLGVSGPKCYLNVAGSNLSKRNPETGRIDKTPDGKWIKGVAYFEPSLEQVIYGD